MLVIDHQGFSRNRECTRKHNTFICPQTELHVVWRILKEINMNLPPTKGKFTSEQETQCRNLEENNLPQYALFWVHRIFFFLIAVLRGSVRGTLPQVVNQSLHAT